MTVAFNDVEMAIHGLCWLLISPAGGRDLWSVGRTITAQLQAQALGDLLVRLSENTNNEHRDELLAIARDFQSLARRRNAVTHALWPSDTEEEHLRGRTIRSTITALFEHPPPIDSKEVEQTTSEAEALWNRIGSLLKAQ